MLISPGKSYLQHDSTHVVRPHTRKGLQPLRIYPTQRFESISLQMRLSGTFGDFRGVYGPLFAVNVSICPRISDALNTNDFSDANLACYFAHKNFLSNNNLILKRIFLFKKFLIFIFLGEKDSFQHIPHFYGLIVS